MTKQMNRNRIGKSCASVLYAALAASLMAFSTGCSTYKQQGKVMTAQWQQGNLPGAIAEYAKKADSKKDSKDAIIWRLEQATVLRAAGQFEESNKAFAQAEEAVDKYEEMAKVRLANEAGALFSNQANLPYEGRTYDKILLNTYKALNFIQLGDLEKARVELIRTYQRQQDAVEINKKRIEKVQEEEAKHKDKAKFDKAKEDPKLKGQLEEAVPPADSLKPYADYVNPFSVYLDGIYFMCAAADNSDLERANKSLERVAGFVGTNKVVSQDTETLKQLMSGQPIPPTTYVIFETGSAPYRDQLRIDIPIIVAKVSYVGAAFPKLKYHSDAIPSLKVTAGEAGATTETIASMDAVIGQEFKNEMPTVITKTIASTVVKAVAAYVVNEAASQQNALVGLFAKIATAGAQAAVNIADLRTWTTLPKEFQACRIQTPADRKIQICDPNGLLKAEVTVGEGTVNLVYVRSINANTQLLVSQAKLK